MKKEFNEERFSAYLTRLLHSYSDPQTDYERGASDTIERISREFITDHYDADDKEKEND